MPPRCGGIGGIAPTTPNRIQPLETTQIVIVIMPTRHQAPPTFARTARIRLPLLVLRRSDCRSRARVVGRRRSAQAKQAIESLVPAAARCGSLVKPSRYLILRVPETSP